MGSVGDFIEDVGKIAANVVTGGAYGQVRAAQKQKKANRKAEQAERVRHFRERSQALAAARVAQAQIENQGASQGVSSSAITGAAGSIGTTVAANIGFAEQTNALNRQRLRLLESADKHKLISGLVQQGMQIAAKAATGGAA